MYCVNSQSDSFGRRILTYNFRVDLLWSYYYFCVKMRLKDSTPMSFHVALVCSRRLNQLWNYFPDSLFLSHHWQWADTLHCCWGAFCMEVSLLYVPSGAGVLLDFFSSVLDRALRFRVVMKGKLDVMKLHAVRGSRGPDGRSWWDALWDLAEFLPATRCCCHWAVCLKSVLPLFSLHKFYWCWTN